jgi:hypothetical protein
VIWRAILVLVLLVAAGCDEVASSPKVPPVPVPPVPVPPTPATPTGRWAMALELHLETYPTVERRIEQSTTGAAWFDLAADGTVTGCVGSRTRDNASHGHYETADHKDHYSASDSRNLVALRGKWTARGSDVTIALTDATFNTCQPAAKGYDPDLQLHCTAAAVTLGAPPGTLVCAAGHGEVLGLGIRLDLPATSLPPPSLRGPSIVLGRDPGVLVGVALERNDRAARITVRAGAAVLREADFTQPKPP